MFSETEAIQDNCRPFRDLVPAYALGALDPAEKKSFVAHLQVCPDCQAELAKYQAVSDGLLLALPPQAPPSRVRAKLIASLAPDRPTADRPRSHFWPFWRWAAGLALAVLIGLNLLTVGQLYSLQQQQAALTQQLRSDQTALGVVTYPESRTINVNATNKAQGTLVLNTELQTAALFVWGLDPVDSAHAYQIWLVRPDGSRVSGGLFRPEPGQPMVSTVIRPAQPLSNFIGLGVTIEPREGSQAPTGQRVLDASF